MERQYLTFWHDQYGYRHATVVTLMVPPHEQPRGPALEELLAAGLRAESSDFRINGAVELSPAVWRKGSRDIVVGDGRIGTVEATHQGWRVHL